MQRNIHALELDKILQMLAEEVSCEDAKKLALRLEPSSSLTGVRRLLEETDAAYVLMARFGSPSFSGLKNIANALRRAEAGGVLTMPELLRVAQVLRTLRGVTEWRSKSEGSPSPLDVRFETIFPNRYLEEKIFTAIASEEEMADSASNELAAIRRKIRSASSRAREQLDKLVRSPVYQKYLQDPIVTMRGGRFVVPVRAECRSEIPGLVHDTSASGATIFVEPMAAVEANNEIRVLLSQEKAEIDRILGELSSEAGSFAGSILKSYQAAVELSLIFAKANLGYKMKASLPEVNDEGKIELKRARHPLIAKEKVVATDIELGVRFDTLVITGPNTGGKTVSLKTIGLLSLMAACGFLLPVADGSRVSVFDRILSDIGDEQSIEQSLSTFSAHMTNIIEIMKEADGRTLVLLDELGAGTDPVEGAALATAILESLRMKGSLLAATTHYAELKAYALQTPGVENACCEFDVATLRPTYRLLIGVPGRSNAFAISLRLGMEEPVIERAKALVSTESLRFEDVVEQLEASRQHMESNRQAAEKERLSAASANQEAQRLRERIQAEADRELEKARQKAAELVARTRGQMDALLEEMEEMKRAVNKGITAEQKARLRAGLKAMENTADPIHKKEAEHYVLPRPLQVGDNVLIYDIDKKATVVELPEKGDSAVVQAGIIRTRVPLENLRLLKQEKSRIPKARVTKDIGRQPSGRSLLELDIRGQTTGEALMEVDRFIDGAVLSGVHQVTIIHGKGTGALRAAVQAHLRSHPAVKSYRLGVFGEGENGVTIAELK
ncbi:endonuclease MutS2 [Hydrogeniiclostridium mannosilyticum]|uniref:endonuclease MutS2 n=1 Tax=Hydrogeniiclostridium mannosilyticum TaxID=2764322 RepID=UPI0018AC6F47